MQFVSTRGAAMPQPFADMLLGALAADGGLFMPEQWPHFQADEILSLANGSYADAALEILLAFADRHFAETELRAELEAAYATFDKEEIAPLVELEPGLYLLELFHGPTLAFKDIALQLLARLMARELERRNGRATILVATSGDTGSAAIEAFGGLPRIELFVLHPKDRVSEVQRRQMTTSAEANVHNIAVEGTFDDAQALVKELFADKPFAARFSLTAVNSINLVRILAQSVYYFTTTAKLGQPARFVVPTGNFGDIFAGEAAARMGLEIAGLVAATNANDILVRALRDGVYKVRSAEATLSPSMDIQVASNFERALFEASGRDSAWLSGAMEEFGRTGGLPIPGAVLEALRARYAAGAASDDETLAAMADAHQRFGRFVDPHTAVGLTAARRCPRNVTPTVVLATADPAKFPETVQRATGMVPPLPPRLRHSYLGPERLTVLPRDSHVLRNFIEAKAPHHAG
jgi:threonine synthase